MNFKTTVEREKEELNEEFMDIIKRFAPDCFAHLSDSDDNDGENFRKSISEALDNAAMAVFDMIEALPTIKGRDRHGKSADTGVLRKKDIETLKASLTTKE